MTDWNKVGAFIGVVIAWPGEDPGYVNLQYSFVDKTTKDGRRGGKFPVSPGKPFRDPSKLLSFAGWLNTTANNKDVWFCTSLQRDKGVNKHGKPKAIRSAQGALLQKSIWIDMDVGATEPGKKPKYATVQDALAAVLQFQKIVGLPRPSAIVFSGSGIHVYWISKDALTPADWQLYASGLKNLLLMNNILCDAGLTTDIARILRMPGTFNHKYDPPKPVELSPLPLKLYDFSTHLDFLKQHAHLTPGPAASAPTHSIYADDADMESFKRPPAIVIKGEPGLDAGIDKFEEVPLDPRPIFKQCGFLKGALLTGGEHFDQTLWMYSILCSTFMENGNAIAHAISKDHSEYSAVDTQALYDRKMAERRERGIGYPSCSTIQGAGCQSCATCPLFAKGKSPLNIRPAVTATVTPQMGQSPQATALSLPTGFDLNAEGIICKVEEKENDGELTTKLIPLFQCLLSNFWAQKHPDCLNYTVTVDKGFVHFASVPHEEMSKTGFKAYLGTERARTLIHTAGIRYLEEFYLSTLGKLRAAAAAQQAVPFGWYEDDGKIKGFVFGGNVMEDTGRVRPCGIGDPNIKMYYTPSGDIQPWLDACKTVTDRKRPELTAIVLMSFASPLAYLGGKDSMMYSAWGDSGAGKSAAYKVGMGVWGHSKLTKGSESSTYNNVTTQMSEIRNLPFYWDEITDDKHRELVAKIMHEASDGVQKGRNKDGRTTQARGMWKLMIMAASNNSYREFLYSRNKNHGASIMRVLEWKVARINGGPGHMQDAVATEIINRVESNYGNMGLRYGQYLALNHARIKEEVIAEQNEVERFFGQNTEERYWQFGVASMICAARYAKLMGVDVDEAEIKDFMYDVFRNNRVEQAKHGMRGGVVEQPAETVLTFYLKDMHAAERVIWTNYMQTGSGRPMQPVQILKGPTQQRNNAGGIECRFSINDRLLVMGTRALDEWLVAPAQKYSTTSIHDALEKEFGAVFKRKLQIASGTVHNIGREPAVVVPVHPGTGLWDFMMLYASPEERKKMEADAPIVEPDLEIDPDTGLVKADNVIAFAERAKRA